MYIRVHVIPSSRRERIVEENEMTLRVEVREPAERNLANKRIKEILAEKFGVALAQVTMLTGHRSSSKMYSIDQGRKVSV